MPNSTTLVQAILAAFCAIMCALSSLGGGGMMEAVRNGAWAKSGGGIPTARDYLQDGLIAMWDGIENAGLGVHDNTIKRWVDLTGNGRDMIEGYGHCEWNWMEDGIALTYQETSPFRANAISESVQVECVFRCVGQDNQPVFSPQDGDNARINVINEDGVWYIPNQYSHATAGVISDINVRNSVSVRNGTTYINGLPAENIKTKDTGFGYGYNNGTCRPGGNSGVIPILWRQSIDNSSKGFYGELFSCRVYGKILTDDEVAHNYAIDRARFNLT